MAKILDYLRRRKAKEKESRSFEQIKTDMESHALPALMLRKTDTATRSYLGGDPYLPEHVEWPSRDGKDLTFLASIDLEEVAATNAIPWLPGQGKLLFFYDIETLEWGLDLNDNDGWSVLHVDQPGADASAQVRTLPQYFVEFVKTSSLPDMERFEELGIGLNDIERDRIFDGCFEDFDDGLDHQIGGYPRPVQGDGMELEVQLASNGVHRGDASGYQSEEVRKLAPGKKDWRLLLQFGSDDDLDVMWGDSGYLYFWVKEQDANRGDFSGVWLVLQCS